MSFPDESNTNEAELIFMSTPPVKAPTTGTYVDPRIFCSTDAYASVRPLMLDMTVMGLPSAAITSASVVTPFWNFEIWSDVTGFAGGAEAQPPTAKANITHAASFNIVAPG
jgi:hypothetical protein